MKTKSFVKSSKTWNTPVVNELQAGFGNSIGSVVCSRFLQPDKLIPQLKKGKKNHSLHEIKLDIRCMSIKSDFFCFCTFFMVPRSDHILINGDWAGMKAEIAWCNSQLSVQSVCPLSKSLNKSSHSSPVNPNNELRISWQFQRISLQFSNGEADFSASYWLSVVAVHDVAFVDFFVIQT